MEAGRERHKRSHPLSVTFFSSMAEGVRTVGEACLLALVQKKSLPPLSFYETINSHHGRSTYFGYLLIL